MRGAAFFEEGGDALGRGPVTEAGVDLAGVLRLADVVVHDPVEAGLGRLLGELDVVLHDLVVGEVRERPHAVVTGRVRVAAAVLDEHVHLALAQGPLAEARVAEGDDAAGHGGAEVVDLLDGRGDVEARLAVRLVDRAGLDRQRHLRVVADEAVLVLDVELDVVELAGLDQRDDRVLGLRFAPGPRGEVRGAHVHRADTVAGRGARLAVRRGRRGRVRAHLRLGRDRGRRSGLRHRVVVIAAGRQRHQQRHCAAGRHCSAKVPASCTCHVVSPRLLISPADSVNDRRAFA